MAKRSPNLRRRVPLLVVKRDIAGAVAWQGEQEFAQSVFEANEGGDGIGAGDSFDAGFLAGWLNGLPLASCLAIACECGRGVAGGVGGLAGQPYQSDMEALQPALRVLSIAFSDSHLVAVGWLISPSPL